MEISGFHWVALRCAQLDKTCTECKARAGEQYNTVAGSCMKCMSTGHMFTDKLVKGYKYPAAPGRDYFSEVGKTFFLPN